MTDWFTLDNAERDADAHDRAQTEAAELRDAQRYWPAQCAPEHHSWWPNRRGGLTCVGCGDEVTAEEL
jgi:hypothetical protein